MNEPVPIKFNERTYFGYKKCPKWLKDIYVIWANKKCMDCGKEDKLEPHRIIRGCDGGLYTFVNFIHPISNVKMLCHKCHEKYNYSRKLNYSLTIK